MKPGCLSAVDSRHRQFGVSLLFALLTLVALSLAAVALVRSVDTGALVIGNLGFKQDSLAHAEQASEAAITWIGGVYAATPANLNADVPAQAYYATAFDNLDPTNRNPAVATRAVVDWDGATTCASYTAGSFATCLRSLPIDAVNGNRARYVVTRLCSTASDPTAAGNVCARPPTASGSSGTSRNAVDYTKPGDQPPALSQPYYRIVVQVQGARNTVTYTETVVHF